MTPSRDSNVLQASPSSRLYYLSSIARHYILFGAGHPYGNIRTHHLFYDVLVVKNLPRDEEYRLGRGTHQLSPDVPCMTQDLTGLLPVKEVTLSEVYKVMRLNSGLDSTGLSMI